MSISTNEYTGKHASRRGNSILIVLILSIKNIFIVDAKVKKILRSYSGDTIETIGKVVLNANHNVSIQNITVIVVKSNGPNLLGRDSLNTLQIDWTNIFTLNTSDVNIFAKYPNLFKAELGMLKDVKVKINVEINHSSWFCKARSVPYSMKEKVDTQLDKMIEQGVLIPVQYSDYTSPIISVLKQDGTVRICADYKQTVNTITSTDSYPIPDIN